MSDVQIRPDLPGVDIAPRLTHLVPKLLENRCDALIVTTLENIRYLTGFTGSAALLIVTPTAALLTTDGRYQTQAAEQLQAAGVDAEIVIGNAARQLEAIVGVASSCARVGLE